MNRLLYLALALLVFAGCDTQHNEQEREMIYFSAEESGLGKSIKMYDVSKEEAVSILDSLRSYMPVEYLESIEYSEDEILERRKVIQSTANKRGTGRAFWNVATAEEDVFDVYFAGVYEIWQGNNAYSVACYHWSDVYGSCEDAGCISFYSDRPQEYMTFVEWDAGVYAPSSLRNGMSFVLNNVTNLAAHPLYISPWPAGALWPN